MTTTRTTPKPKTTPAANVSIAKATVTLTAIESPLHKYAAGVLAITLVVVQALVTTTDLSPTTIIQLAIVFVAAVGTYFIPLLSGPWAGAGKTGVIVVGAILSALVPLITGHSYTPQTIGLVILAGVQALVTQLGVDVRKDQVALAA